jgi:hypothetical protein
MKRSRYYSHDHPVRKVACTVSAAALMLGVSQAATVGFNFQANYCGSASYPEFDLENAHYISPVLGGGVG